jgi:hypothetical protein
VRKEEMGQRRAAAYRDVQIWAVFNYYGLQLEEDVAHLLLPTVSSPIHRSQTGGFASPPWIGTYG